MLTCEISDSKLDFEAYLVIDSTVLGKCSGGVRMSLEITIDETRCLARNMPLKYGFLGIPMGGAKLGIRVNKHPSGLKRKQIFVQIGRHLEPFIIRGCFYPWVDMGVSWKDIDLLRNSATHQNRIWPKYPTGDYTSWTMLVSTEEALEEKGLKINEKTAAVQGFGKVGSSAAKVFSEKGAKVVAVSTINGAIYNPHGLEVAKLLMLKEKFGDDLVNNEYGNTSKIDKEELLSLPVDILLFGGGSWQINARNNRKVQAKIVCAGANIAITRDAEERLFSRGIAVLPDFISNCGGVLGSYVAKESLVKRIINVWFRSQVRRILKLSSDRGVAPSVVAEEIAMRRFNEMKARHERRVGRKIYQLLTDEMIPGLYRKLFFRVNSMAREGESSNKI